MTLTGGGWKSVLCYVESGHHPPQQVEPNRVYFLHSPVYHLGCPKVGCSIIFAQPNLAHAAQASSIHEYL